jgi:TonB family protein
MGTAIIRPAFRYDFGPALLKRTEHMGSPINRRHFSKVALICFSIHVLVLLLNPKWFFSPPKVDLEESISVDMDFMADLKTEAPQINSLPNAVKSEDLAVPANLLPQLPKKFEVEEEIKSEVKTFVEEKDPKAEDALAKKEVAPPDEEVQKMKDNPNKVTREDLLKRLAMEKLKRDHKVDLQMKAQKDAIAKLKEDVVTADAKSNSGTGTVGVSGVRVSRYEGLLAAAVKRNLYLPKTFEFDKAVLVSQLSVVINEKGELMDVTLSRSSGNGAYDQAVILALQNSVPLPKPPQQYAGKAITFNFSK